MRGIQCDLPLFGLRVSNALHGHVHDQLPVRLSDPHRGARKRSEQLDDRKHLLGIGVGDFLQRGLGQLVQLLAVQEVHRHVHREADLLLGQPVGELGGQRGEQFLARPRAAGFHQLADALGVRAQREREDVARGERPAVHVQAGVGLEDVRLGDPGDPDVHRLGLDAAALDGKLLDRELGVAELGEFLGRLASEHVAEREHAVEALGVGDARLEDHARRVDRTGQNEVTGHRLDELLGRRGRVAAHGPDPVLEDLRVDVGPDEAGARLDVGQRLGLANAEVLVQLGKGVLIGGRCHGDVDRAGNRGDRGVDRVRALVEVQQDIGVLQLDARDEPGHLLAQRRGVLRPLVALEILVGLGADVPALGAVDSLALGHLVGRTGVDGGGELVERHRIFGIEDEVRHAALADDRHALFGKQARGLDRRLDLGVELADLGVGVDQIAELASHVGPTALFGDLLDRAVDEAHPLLEVVRRHRRVASDDELGLVVGDELEHQVQAGVQLLDRDRLDRSLGDRRWVDLGVSHDLDGLFFGLVFGLLLWFLLWLLFGLVLDLLALDLGRHVLDLLAPYGRQHRRGQQGCERQHRATAQRSLGAHSRGE